MKNYVFTIHFVNLGVHTEDLKEKSLRVKDLGNNSGIIRPCVLTTLQQGTLWSNLQE